MRVTFAHFRTSMCHVASLAVYVTRVHFLGFNNWRQSKLHTSRVHCPNKYLASPKRSAPVGEDSRRRTIHVGIPQRRRGGQPVFDGLVTQSTATLNVGEQQTRQRRRCKRHVRTSRVIYKNGTFDLVQLQGIYR